MTMDIVALRDHVETDLPDLALQTLLDDAEAAIEEKAGSTAQFTRLYRGGVTFLELAGPVASVDTVVETWEETDTTLAADDYELWHGGRMLRRLETGTNAATWWAPKVSVTATPKDQGGTRERVTVDLVKLAISYNALTQERAGNYTATSPEYQKERNRILAELQRGRPLFV